VMKSGGIEQVTFIFTDGVIVPGSTFSIDLNNNGLFGQNPGGFGAKGKLIVTPIFASVAEPETVPLLLVGLAGLCFLQRRRSTVI
jgi:hypothetical protein